MRRSRRNRRNDNQIIEAIKYYQNSVANALIFVGIPVALAFVAFALWVGTPSGRDFMGFTENDIKSEQRLKELQSEMNSQEERMEEEINQDVQNTIDDIQGATEDTTGAEYYEEDVYTAPETQESVEQPTEEMNGANNNVSETQKKEVHVGEYEDITPDAKRQCEGPRVDYDEEGNIITEKEE